MKRFSILMIATVAIFCLAGPALADYDDENGGGDTYNDCVGNSCNETYIETDTEIYDNITNTATGGTATATGGTGGGGFGGGASVYSPDYSYESDYNPSNAESNSYGGGASVSVSM